MEQTSLQNVTGTGDTAKKFAGLPIGLLICQPLLEAAKGQLAMCLYPDPDGTDLQ